jgi:hypothetical protein
MRHSIIALDIPSVRGRLITSHFPWGESHPGVVLANFAASLRKSTSDFWPPSGTVNTLICVTTLVWALIAGTVHSS